MSRTRSRVALAGAAVTLALGAATGGTLVAGGDATAAQSGSAATAAQKGKRPKVKALNTTIRDAVKAARKAEGKRLTPDQVREAVAPAVAKAVADGKVPQKLVDRRAARLQALSDALGG